MRLYKNGFRLTGNLSPVVYSFFSYDHQYLFCRFFFLWVLPPLQVNDFKTIVSECL